jgi:hypothetical protein
LVCLGRGVVAEIPDKLAYRRGNQGNQSKRQRRRSGAGHIVSIERRTTLNCEINRQRHIGQALDGFRRGSLDRGVRDR